MHDESLIKGVLADYVKRPDMTIRQIADKHGVSSAAVMNWAKRAKLKPRKPGRPRQLEPSALHRQILELAASHSYEDVAQRFGVAKQEIGRIVKHWRAYAPPRRPPFHPGDIIECDGRRYTVYAADFYAGSVMDEEGRFLPRFAWKRSSLVEKVGETQVPAAWYENTVPTSKRRRHRPRKTRVGGRTG